jgi:hypothetical protein
VSILPRRNRIRELEGAGLVDQVPIFGNQPEDDWCYQGLELVAKNATIYKLIPQVWLDGQGPYLISWARTQVESYETETRRMTVKPVSRHLDVIVPSERVQLPMWYASKSGATSKVSVRLNSDPPMAFPLPLPTEQHVDFDLEFIGENFTDKRRKYRLNLNSWDELGLTER